MLEAAVASMAATLVHRGPDDEGCWTDAAGGVALGFRRLAVLDRSAAGRQPMLSGDGRYACVFNGEIYNHRDLRAELERRGVRFRGSSDTEVVVEAVAACGPRAAVGRLWGMFALAVWDRVERTLLLARDRLGKKPLHVARLGTSGWLFASELKAFHAVDRFRGEIDPAALATYLRFGYVPAPHTIFRDAWKPEPGTCSLLRFGRPVRSERYWSARTAARRGVLAPHTGPPGALVEELDRLLRDAVGRRLIADVPVGALLSGGIDSAAVVALMQAQSARPVRTYTVGFDEPEYDESAPAAAVAQHLGTDHTALAVSPAAVRDVIPELADVYDEPFADSSQIPTLLVSRLARRHVTVALSGDGGDEVFAGYRHYRTVAALSAAIAAVPGRLRRPAGALLTRVPRNWWDAAVSPLGWALPANGRRRFGERVHRAGRLLAAGRIDDALYWRLVSLWPDPGALAPEAGPGRVAWEASHLEADVPDFRARMTLYDLVSYLPDDILAKVDRASMAASLEVRSPLLDHRVVEWAWRLPYAMKRRRGLAKWILRQVLYRHVPPRLVDRPKRGFSLPLDRWLRGPLRDWAEHLLRTDRIEAAGLRPAPVHDAWRRHLAGSAEEHRLWAVLMLVAWRERWCRSRRRHPGGANGRTRRVT